MSIPVKEFLKARRDRALGSILGYAERELFPVMSTDQQRKLRQLVLDALNSYHDSALDLFKSDTATLHNDEVVPLLNKILEAQQQQRIDRKDPVS